MVLLLLGGGVFALGQTNPNTDQGMKPYDSFHGSAIDSVSLTSGNLILHVPLYSSPQRGQLAFKPFMLYNNKGFSLLTNCVGTPPQCTYTWIFRGNGVQIFDEQDPQLGLGVTSKRVDTGAQDGNGNEIWVNTYSAVTVDGSTHQLADTGNGYRSIDGSGIVWNSSTNVTTDRQGISFGALKAEDPNGNFVSLSVNGIWTDTLGRTFPQPQNATATSTGSCPQLNLQYQPVTAAYSWSLPGFPAPSGTSQFLLCYTSVAIHTAFSMGQQVSESDTMLQSVVLPDGTAWTFQYDGANPNDTTSIGYGDLLKVGFPVGGSLTYTYGTETPYSGQYSTGLVTSQSRSVLTRTLDANDGAGPHQSTYSWGNPLVSTATTYTVENKVTDPLNNDTVHVINGLFGGPALYETQTRFYSGSETSGTLMKTVNTDYSYSSNPFDNLGSTANPPTAINVMPIRVTTIWPNGQTSKVETDYDSGFTFRDPTWGLPIYPPQGSTSATYPGTLGSATARREFDYGSGSAGNLLRETFTTYLWQSNTNYLGANLIDLDATVTVCSPLGSGESADATGCTDPNFTLKRRSQAVSGYDDPSRLSNTTITTQHGAPPGAVRGNLTSVAHWLNTSGCNPQTAGSCPTTYTNWFDTGEVSQTIDPLNHTTTHTYSSTYAGAYPTLTCNALNQCVSGAYDGNTGLITSFTDANGQTSNFAYDSMWRLTQALGPTDPVSGLRPETDFDHSVATQVKRSKRQNATAWIYDYAYFDGVGRVKQTRLVDPLGDDYVDTTYDAIGRVSTVSNPHRSAGSATDGITTTSYDALSRVTQVSEQDGGVVRTDYSQLPAVTVTDEAGKARKSQSDALGRLISVWEDPAGLNYETDYQYDALGNLLRVDQKGTAPSDNTQWRTRLFSYDSYSRLLTAYNPESGTISYAYDSDSNLTGKTAPAPNQTGSATVTTTYAYDALHRLTSKTYSDGATLSANFAYDGAGWWGITQTNTVGRMQEAWVGTTCCGAVIFGYDALGRVILNNQCLPDYCPSGGVPVSFAYDLAGEMTSYTNGAGVTLSQVFDSAGRVSQLTSSMSDAQHPATLATVDASAGYYASGELRKVTFGNGLTETAAFNNRLQPCRLSVNTS